MTILITGATGTVSGELLRQLATMDTPPVRALVRDPSRAPDGVEVVRGDLDDPKTLEHAFAGVSTLWLLTAMGPQAPHQSMNAVWAARHAGVKHVVRHSAIGAAHDAPTRNGRLHALSDAELRASGMDWTILKPHFFMQNLFGSVSGDTLYGGLGDGRLGMVDTRDVAEFGARVLLDPAAHAGQTYTITGPDSVSLHDLATAAGAALGRRVSYQPVSEEQAYQAMVGAGMRDWDAAVTTEYLRAYASGWGDFTTTAVPDVTGHPARSIAEFAQDNSASL